MRFTAPFFQGFGELYLLRLFKTGAGRESIVSPDFPIPFD
jgi:hypothetical protein